MQSYHNTTHSSGQVLIEFENKAKNQEEIILDFFGHKFLHDFTPDEVLEQLGLENTPITSIRRAITNLTDRGKLIKTNIQRTGKYGKPTYAWKLNTNK